MEIPKIITNNKVALVLASLVLFGVSWRLMPHLPNFAPVNAIALLGGVAFSKRRAIWLPLAIMALSDFFIGFYHGFEWTWLSVALVVFVGMSVKRLSLGWRISIGALGGSIIFFTVSNFGVWLTSGMYVHTFAGLVDCYTMGIPFFRATLLSDLMFVAVLLSAAEYATSGVQIRTITTQRTITPPSL